MPITEINKTRKLFASLAIGLIALTPAAGFAQTALTPGEARTTHAFDAAKKLGTPDLYAFLKPMPKGADLHMHLGGANYAENVIAEGVKQGLCIDPVAVRTSQPVTGPDAPCGAGKILLSEAVNNQKMYDHFIDTASMRSFVPTAGDSGHDHFFDAFGHLGGGGRGSTALSLDEVATRAAAQNEQYLEIMSYPGPRPAGAGPRGAGVGPAAAGATPGAPGAGRRGAGGGGRSSTLTWPEDAETTVTTDELAKLRDEILATGLRDQIPNSIKEVDNTEAQLRTMEKCSEKPLPASSPCNIKIHYLYSVSRGAQPMQVFTSMVTGFELNMADPRLVGINILAPEDGRVSMRDYHLQMLMFEYLHSVYPKVHLSLHAGELAPGLVPPEGLRFHIREAVELAHAERIGHGVDVLYEDDAAGLLKEMAAKHIMVEINLTSNDVILGVKGIDHPLSGYRAAHVPVALSTDDEGVSRIDLTHEYVKGAFEQNLSYVDLKQMARTSLEHSFLYGETLWAAPDDFNHRKAACAAPITATSKPTVACAALLQANEKAAEEWEMERRFAVFEAAH